VTGFCGVCEADRAMQPILSDSVTKHNTIQQNKNLKTIKMKTTKTNKQGECGFFCFKYWLGSGCDDCLDYHIKSNKTRKNK